MAPLHGKFSLSSIRGRRLYAFLIVLSGLALFAIILPLSLLLPSNVRENLTPTTKWIPTAGGRNKPAANFSPPQKDNGDPDRVELDYLSFRPIKEGNVKLYWNIPYAASTGGNNRFRGPQPPPLYNQNGTMEFSGQFGMCPNIQKIDQKLRNKNDVAGEDIAGIYTSRTEDCLSLHVFTPVDAQPGDDLPVLVNIPGGGFHLPGRGNGKDFVEKSRKEKDGKVDFKGIIVVMMYYRNGIYGFLSGDEIAKDGDFNMGLRDQRASLEWVQKYIRYFGGNADHVVLMGTSAGGTSVVSQLTAKHGDHTYPVPGSGQKPLFHGAIMQSPAGMTYFNPEQANDFYQRVARGVGCGNDTSVACVRNASIGDLYYQNYPMSFPRRNTPPRWMWAPTAEKGPNALWTEPGVTAVLNGHFARVPTLIGYTSNEGTDQVFKTIDNEGEFKSYIKDHYPLLTDDDLDLLVKNYPNDRHWPDSGSWWDAVSKAQGELRYICPTYLTAQGFAHHNANSTSSGGRVPTYTYQWDVHWGPDNTNGYGTKHAATVGQVLARRDNELSDYFISFIKHLNPNTERRKGTAEWEDLDERGRRMLFTNREDEARSFKIRMEDRDEKRESRCRVYRGMMSRTQQ
ncbi:alpha/beta-hydrolase [Periconia macrospinosa]|uniref:Carboxylic ester hydrolase n=1 Tax=Periconia macrospinosa TaxID=97972 RepID=A0A2V1E5Q6_9PLEO|nr:alpha/beta-hydrolase [Periconia macrospinosa]